jgi:uncharacterized protein (TIGR03083 family)
MAAPRQVAGKATWRMVLEERDDMLAFFRDLTPEQWVMPSLCPGWRIKDVAAHLLIDEPVQRGMALRMLPFLAKGGFSVDQVNSRWVDANRDRSPASIVESFRQDTVRGVGLMGLLLGPAVALRALVIHHQDMRRPLRLIRTIPPVRLVAVLDALLTWRGDVSIGSRSRAKDLRFSALDVTWSYGDGPEVFGPGEAIVMALAGRRVALKELGGGGKAVLAQRP